VRRVVPSERRKVADRSRSGAVNDCSQTIIPPPFLQTGPSGAPVGRSCRAAGPSIGRIQRSSQQSAISRLESRPTRRQVRVSGSKVTISLVTGGRGDRALACKGAGGLKIPVHTISPGPCTRHRGGRMTPRSAPSSHGRPAVMIIPTDISFLLC
jgi:hypothetical protein